MLKELPSLLPRPLRILVIVVVVLGIVSCGVGFFRGPEKDRNATPGTSDQANADSLPFLAPPRVSADQLSGCPVQVPERRIDLTGSCTLTVPQAGLRPAKLVLVQTSGAASVKVTQTVEGETFAGRSLDGPRFEVTTTRSGVTTLEISCLTACRLTVEQ